MLFINRLKGIFAVVLAVGFLGSAAPALAFPHTSFRDSDQWTQADGVTPAGQFSWAHEAIKDATHWEIFQGVSEGTVTQPVLDGGRPQTWTVTPKFLPADFVTRAQFAVILARTTGLDAVAGGAVPFTDMAGDEWFAPFVKALYSKGVIRQTDRPDGLFKASASITRVEMAAWIARAAEAVGIELTAQPLTFADKAEIDAYWQEDLAKAVSLDVVRGYTDGRFGPADTANRAQGAVMMTRLVPRLPRKPTLPLELMNFMRDASDSTYKYAKELMGTNWDQVDFAAYRERLAPWYVDSALKGYYNPDRDSKLLAEPYGWGSGYVSLLTSDLAERIQNPKVGYRPIIVQQVEVITASDQLAKFQATLVVESLPVQSPRKQSRIQVEVWARKDGGKWRLSGCGPEKLLETATGDALWYPELNKR